MLQACTRLLPLADDVKTAVLFILLRVATGSYGWPFSDKGKPMSATSLIQIIRSHRVPSRHAEVGMYRMQKPANTAVFLQPPMFTFLPPENARGRSYPVELILSGIWRELESKK